MSYKLPLPESETDEEPRLFLPVEIPSRELLHKCLISKYALEAGLKPVIGKANSILALALSDGQPNEIFLHKGGIEVKFAKILHKRRVHLVILDEELSPSGAATGEASSRLNSELIPYIFLYLATSKDYAAEIIAGFPDLRDRVRTVGFPRLDLLRTPIFDRIRTGSSSDIQTPSILICSSFGVTSIRGMVSSMFVTINYERQNLIGAWKLGSRSKFQLVGNTLRKICDVFRFTVVSFSSAIRFAQMLPRVCLELAPTRIVFRAHPGEDEKLWVKAVGASTNAELSLRNPLEVDLIDAHVLVHLNSTTAVQANLLGIPTVSISEIFRRTGPTAADLLSTTVASEAELIKTLKRLREENRSARRYGSEVASSSLVVEEIKQEIRRALHTDLTGTLQTNRLMEQESLRSEGDSLPVGLSSLGRLLRLLGIGQKPKREREIDLKRLDSALCVLNLENPLIARPISDCFMLGYSPSDSNPIEV